MLPKPRFERSRKTFANIVSAVREYCRPRDFSEIIREQLARQLKEEQQFQPKPFKSHKKPGFSAANFQGSFDKALYQNLNELEVKRALLKKLEGRLSFLAKPLKEIEIDLVVKREKPVFIGDADSDENKAIHEFFLNSASRLKGYANELNAQIAEHLKYHQMLVAHGVDKGWLE